MRARIDITEVETRTKIRAKYLRAIENEEWDLLPGPVYVKSFLRTYGDYLGVDSRMLIDEYKRRYERPAEHETRPIAALGRDRERQSRGPLLPPWALIAGVLVVVVVALYLLGNSGSQKATPPTTVATTTTHRHRHRHQKRHVTPPAPTSVKLQLTPTGTVYVCLVNAAGTKLIDEQTYSVGDTIPTETGPELLLTLGNAEVTMKVNGKSVPVPPASPIRLELTPTSVKPIALTASPPCG